jgi:hypothetical protein
LYVADWVTERLYIFVEENEQAYTKEEVHRAKQAYELVKISGYPSSHEVLHLIQDGKVHGMPMFTVADLESA